MKEIALLGTTGHVFGDVLSAMLHDGLTVKALVDFPERVMLNDVRLTVDHLDLANHQSVVDTLTGYDTAVLTYSDDLQDVYTNELTLKYFVDTVTAARQAGLKRIIVVGSPQSEAFFVTELRRLDDIDWVFISTEGPFAVRASDEVTEAQYHSQTYPVE